VQQVAAASIRAVHDGLTERVERWRSRGEDFEFRDHRIHTLHRPRTGTPLLLLHGFPSSSYDWRLLLDELPDRAAIAFDFLGFGLSDKPRDHDYTLVWQADLTEAVVERFGGGPVAILAHDIGTSVVTELMARDLRGEGRFEITEVTMLNGSIVQHVAHPTRAQRLLLSPAGAAVAKRQSASTFRRGFGSIFSEANPLGDEEAADQWSLLRYHEGHRIAHRLIQYMRERERLADRWHGAFADWNGPLGLVWGMADPVAHPGMLDTLLELRPAAAATRLDRVGHYPQIEVPRRVAALVP
jgi:pimeloyl-ACP methyl ester carboxylesterase